MIDDPSMYDCTTQSQPCIVYYMPHPDSPDNPEMLGSFLFILTFLFFSFLSRFTHMGNLTIDYSTAANHLRLNCVEC
jgi:hypothetical protein